MSSVTREGPYEGRRRSPSPDRGERPSGGPSRGHRGGRGRGGRGAGAASSDPAVIDHSRICPLLIKIFVFDKGAHPSEPQQLEEHRKDANEIHVHTWLDTSLSDLKSLLKKVWTNLQEDVTVTFYRSTVGSDGNATTNLLGVVPSSTATTHTPSSTLAQSGMEKGDQIFVTVA